MKMNLIFGTGLPIVMRRRQLQLHASTPKYEVAMEAMPTEGQGREREKRVKELSTFNIFRRYGGIAMTSVLKLKAVSVSDPNESAKRETVDIGNGSDVVYIQRFAPFDQSWNWFHYLDKQIPWTRPTIRVFGKFCLQPRDTCYVATPGLTELSYSGYQPRAYSWDDYPPLKDILDAVHKALPGSSFNSLLLNRYKGGNDYVGWHADDEKLYGPTPEIASVSFGCERDFILKKKPCKKSCDGSDEPASKRLKNSSHADQHTFRPKHGSLLVMRGYTQRDWIHSVPKRAKAEATRINLTFRRVF